MKRHVLLPLFFFCSRKGKKGWFCLFRWTVFPLWVTGGKKDILLATHKSITINFYLLVIIYFFPCTAPKEIVTINCLFWPKELTFFFFFSLPPGPTATKLRTIKINLEKPSSFFRIYFGIQIKLGRGPSGTLRQILGGRGVLVGIATESHCSFCSHGQTSQLVTRPPCCSSSCAHISGFTGFSWHLCTDAVKHCLEDSDSDSGAPLEAWMVTIATPTYMIYYSTKLLKKKHDDDYTIIITKT